MGRRGVHVPQTVPGDPGDAHGFPALVVEFCTDLAARGYSPATIRARRQALATLAAWLADRGVTRPVEVTRPMLVRYQRHLFHYRKANGEPLSFRSQNARLLPVRAFFKWAVRNDHLASNPASELELPRVEHRLPKPALTIGEAEQVLAVPDVTTTAGLRDRVIIETFYGTGIRRAELAHLNLRDLDVERRTLTVRQGKGRKDRMIPIGTRALAWIDRYLTQARPRLAGEPDDGTLFLTVDGTPFSLDRLTQLVRDHVVASGVGKQGACHLFRHTLATLMLEGGADIRYIQAMLGHAELSTTQIYTQVSIRALQAVHTATFPAATNPPHDGARAWSTSPATTTARPRESRRPSCLLLLTKRSKKRTAPTPDHHPPSTPESPSAPATTDDDGPYSSCTSCRRTPPSSPPSSPSSPPSSPRSSPRTRRADVSRPRAHSTAARLDPMTTHARHTHRPAWALALLAAVLAVLVGPLAAGPASAATASGAETRVGAFTSAAPALVGAPSGVVAGQRLGNDPSRAQVVVATGVAANTEPALSSAFHHTGSGYDDSIMESGLRPGSYATPTEGLSPLQAHIELALNPAGGARNALLQVDVAGLRQAGYEIPRVTRVTSAYGMAGGGYEMQFPYAVPSEFLKVVWP